MIYSLCHAQVSEPLYTEDDLNALRDQHAQEIQLLQNEFQ